MELIQIIYDTLILGTGLLFLVVLVSFVKYKINGPELKRPPGYVKNKRQPEVLISVPVQAVVSAQQAPISFRTTNAYTPRVKSDIPIYRLDQYKTREIKIVRKPTSTPFTDERADQSFSRLTRTNGNGKSGRYRILNEELKTDQQIRIVNYNS